MSDKLLKAEITTVLRKAEFKAMELLEGAYLGKKIKVKDLNGSGTTTGICRSVLDVSKGTLKDGFKVTLLLDVNNSITLDVTCYSSLIERVDEE